MTNKMTRSPPGLASQQRGWVFAALIVFLGVAYTGPALARFNRRQKSARRRLADKVVRTRDRVQASGRSASRRLRRLGGGPI